MIFLSHPAYAPTRVLSHSTDARHLNRVVSHPPQPIPTDDALVARARTGDRDALGELVARYHERAYRLALRISGNEQDAEDIVQNAFLQVCRKLGTFRGDAQFGTWLYRVTMNEALMAQRARQRDDAESLEAYLPRFDESGAHTRLDVDYARAADVETLIDRERLQREVRSAVDRLPPIYRTAFVLCDLEELSAPDAAKILEIDAAAVRQRVHRARLMMRGFLGRLAGSESA